MSPLTSETSGLADSTPVNCAADGITHMLLREQRRLERDEYNRKIAFEAAVCARSASELSALSARVLRATKRPASIKGSAKAGRLKSQIQDGAAELKCLERVLSHVKSVETSGVQTDCDRADCARQGRVSDGASNGALMEAAAVAHGLSDRLAQMEAHFAAITNLGYRGTTDPEKPAAEALSAAVCEDALVRTDGASCWLDPCWEDSSRWEAFGTARSVRLEAVVLDDSCEPSEYTFHPGSGDAHAGAIDVTEKHSHFFSERMPSILEEDAEVEVPCGQATQEARHREMYSEGGTRCETVDGSGVLAALSTSLAAGSNVAVPVWASRNVEFAPLSSSSKHSDSSADSELHVP